MLVYPVLTLEVLLMNGLLLLTVVRSPQLRTPHLQLICANSASDILLVLFITPFSLALLFINSYEPMIWLCRLQGSLKSILFFVPIHFNLFLSVERYQFFIHPLIYQTRFRNIKIMILLISIPAILYGVFTEIFIGREFRAVVLECQLPDTRAVNLIMIFLFLVPALLIMTFCIISLVRLAAKQKTQVRNLQTDVIGYKSRTRFFIKNAKDSIRMILLVSGISYGSYLPAFLIRDAVFRKGVTWEDLNIRRDEILSVGFRVLHMFTIFLPVCVNPWIYIHLNKQLRKEVYKTLHLNISPDMSNIQTIASVNVGEK